nr:L,D-transpeptidase [Kofleriaceae bacterium]
MRWFAGVVAGLGLVVSAAGACGGHPDAPASDDAGPAVPPGSDAPAAIPGVPGPSQNVPDGTHSLELKRTLTVRLDPGSDAKIIGTIGVDTRVAVGRAESAHGCGKPWVEVEPRGWVCSDYMVPSKKLPYGQEVPHLERGEIVPGVYGKVTVPNSMSYMLEKPEPPKKKPKKDRDRDRKQHGRPVTSPSDVDDDANTPATTAAGATAKGPHMVEDKPLVGSVNVRQYDEVTIDGKTYWKVSQKDNQYVLASAITRHQPSRWGGARLGDDTGWGVPFGFVWPRGGMYEAYTLAKATGGGVVREVPARTAVPVLDAQDDAAGKPTAYRIGAAEWIAAADAKVFTVLPPPPLLQPGERWIDVDLDAQILVAYEGDTPVYATLVSTGGKETPTKTGVYRIWRKESEADMNGLNGEDPYSVATVPWTEFFSVEDQYALHTAYWHDGFGRARSHGCVNLAPRDARWLYFWSDPQVPPGWVMSAGNVDAPGSIVRIRSAADPSPEYRGYAKRVYEARQVKGAGQ